VPLDGVLTHVQNLGSTAPLKFGKTKNVKNSARFRTTFRFWLQISLEGIKISTSGKWRYKLLFFLCWTKKIDELWSTNHEVVFAHFDLPKMNSARVFGQLLTLTVNISGMNKDIDKRLTAFITTIDSTLNAEKNGGLGFTNHKVVFAHFDLSNIDSSLVFGQL